MSGQDVRIKSSPDGEFGAYLASPASGRGPGLVVIQEIFGVNSVMRKIADEFAARGYFALAPDLFWRLEPGVQLSDQSDAEWKRAFDLMGRFDQDAGVKDIQTSITYLRHSVAGCTGKVGAVGYCLGGLLAFLTATRTDCDAAVGYYGVNIQEKLSEAAKIRKPVMLHIAGKDEYVPPEAQKKIVEGLKNNPLVTIHSYAEMNHAFARAGGAHYDKACADLANGRTSTFLRQHLS
ncbi:MAG TPA: dienelactone hydrolase family protein [Rhizomicrobium sp.]|jgi:carboxymethylenebutenolidase|nr:dienelactone hydrolase family protein [Rhizomicrobium sp.]